MAYKLSFSKTLELNDEIRKNEQKLTWLKEKEKEIPFLKAKMTMIEEAYSDSLSVRDKLTATISDYAENHNCLVTEIPSSSHYSSENIKIETNTFTLRGSFSDLLKLELKLENEFKISAKVVSAKFFSLKDHQMKRKNLYLTLITQSFNQITNSK
ncbi:MAG: hypothetical protein Q8L81_10310 [Bacteroidota bacterium]|nr:hypothetical protein [Bacteroidota bacterium]